MEPDYTDRTMVQSAVAWVACTRELHFEFGLSARFHYKWQSKSRLGSRRHTQIERRHEARSTPDLRRRETRMARKKAPARKKGAIRERYSKTQIVTAIAEATGVARKQVSSVLEELAAVIEGHISKNGVGQFVLPGLMRIVTVKKPARKARKGINPFTGEETMFKAKPASIQVKIRPLKKLKEMVG